MVFAEIKPSGRLSQFIQSFWWMELNGNANGEGERILPCGASEMILHVGNNVNRIIDNRLFREPDCLFIGPNTNYYTIAAAGPVKMLGIKFYPHAAAFLLREDASQFVNTMVDVRDIWSGSMDKLYERIAEATTIETRLKQAEEFFTRRLPDDDSLKLSYLHFATKSIKDNNGQVTIPWLTDKLGITPRYLEKLFFSFVGISPKAVIQIAQLQYSVQLLASAKKRSLTEISYASGYYDQSHFIRAIKRFTGFTPSQLRQEKMPFQRSFFVPATATL